MKLRIYLDTSVLGALVDERMLDRQMQTSQLWARLPEFEASTSDLAREEIQAAPDPRVREELERLIRGLLVHPVTDEARELAGRYVESGVFPARAPQDALHVAVAVTTRQDVLVSWNFKHLVNRRRRAMVNQMNIRLGLPTIDIVAPPEV